MDVSKSSKRLANIQGSRMLAPGPWCQAASPSAGRCRRGLVGNMALDLSERIKSCSRDSINQGRGPITKSVGNRIHWKCRRSTGARNIGEVASEYVENSNVNKNGHFPRSNEAHPCALAKIRKEPRGTNSDKEATSGISVLCQVLLNWSEMGHSST